MHLDPGYGPAITKTAMVSKDISRNIHNIINRANKASCAFEKLV